MEVSDPDLLGAEVELFEGAGSHPGLDARQVVEVLVEDLTAGDVGQVATVRCPTELVARSGDLCAGVLRRLKKSKYILFGSVGWGR